MIGRVLAAGLLLLGACRTSDQASAAAGSLPLMPVTVALGQLSAVAAVPPGWVRLEERAADSIGHRVIAFQLAAGTDPAAFIAALDSSQTTPAGGAALGGPDGAAREAIIQLAPGTVLIACLARDSAGRRHATRGEWQRIEVSTGAGGAPVAPAAGVTIDAADFAYGGSDRWPAGEQLVQLRNIGAADHLVLISRLKPGIGLRDWMSAEDPESVSERATGIARLGAGHSAFLRMKLQPGKYALYCLITDPRTGKLHFELGMLREITVTDSASAAT